MIVTPIDGRTGPPGLQSVLRMINLSPAGGVLLVLKAVGLPLFGVYCFAWAANRRRWSTPDGRMWRDLSASARVGTHSDRTMSTEISTAATVPRFSSQCVVVLSSGQPTPGP